MVSAPTRSSRTVELPPFEVRGGAVAVMTSTAREQLLEGPRGTGKTMALCWWLHTLALKYPRSRLLICRKVAETLTTTVLVTFGEKILTPADPVHFFGGNKHEPASYRYANGSRIVVGGLDKDTKVLSSEYDFIYVNEATELNVEDWEGLTALLRNNVMPYQRLVGDCNPTHNKHWLLKRCQSGKTRHVKSRLEDNPAYFDEVGNMTPAGVAYVATLDALTGTRYRRFRLGEWIGVENAIYDNFSRERHMLRGLPADTVWIDGAIGVDYGDVHPHAAVAVSVAKGGRKWVRETWLGRDFGELVATVGRMKAQYKITKVRVDAMLKGWERAETSPIGGRVNRADSSPGARKTRIEYTYRGWQDDALSIDPAGPGNDVLAEQIETYHYEHRQTDTIDDLIVARIDEDAVAALEDAIEELDAVRVVDLGALTGLSQRAPTRAIGGLR